MNHDVLIRYGKPAALLGAVLGIVGDAYHFTLDDRSDVAQTFGYRAHGILLMASMFLLVLALLRIVAILGARGGALGRIGFFLALAGTMTTFGDIWAESIVLPGVTAEAPQLLNDDASGFHLGAVAFSYLALFALGWLLVAIATLRAGLASKPAAILLAVAAVIAGLPLGGSYVLLVAAVAWVAWTLPDRPATHRSESAAVT